MGEEDGPAVANELVERDGTVGGLSLEVRGSRAETETVGMREDVQYMILKNTGFLEIVILCRHTYGAARSWAIVTVYGRDGRWRYR